MNPLPVQEWVEALHHVLTQPWAAGLIGSLWSMKGAGQTRSERLLCVLAGLTCSIYVVPLLIEWTHTDLPALRSFLALVGGLLGMDLLVKFIEWRKTADWPAIGRALLGLGNAIKTPKSLP